MSSPRLSRLSSYYLPNMLGDQAQSLVSESLRSQQTSTLLPYNTPLVRQLVRESTSHSAELTTASAIFASQLSPDDGTSAKLTITALALGRANRALLVYHHQRLDLLRDRLWAAGAVKAAAFGQATDTGRHMTDLDAAFAKGYYDLVAGIKTSLYGGVGLEEAVDLTGGGVEMGPPRELMVNVRARREVGEVLLPVSLRRVVLSKGSQYYLPRAEVDAFVVAGELEIVQ